MWTAAAPSSGIDGDHCETGPRPDADGTRHVDPERRAVTHAVRIPSSTARDTPKRRVWREALVRIVRLFVDSKAVHELCER